MKKKWYFKFVDMMVTAIFVTMTAGMCLADDPGASAAAQGLLPVPDYSGKLGARTTVTGDWGGVRKEWADRGVTIGFDWYQVYQDIVNGGIDEGGENATNLDYRLNLDLMRMGLVPGALVTVRGQSRFGDTVNGNSGLLLPVNMYSSFPVGEDEDADVNFAITELNWLQFLSDEFALLAGKITTTATSNEFMGGDGRTQFMNFQLSFSATLAQLAPYSTLAASAVWIPSPKFALTTTLMNYEEASTTSGFDDIGDGATWATTGDYRVDINQLPGGGSISFFYGFDTDFVKVGSLTSEPDGSLSVDTTSSSWAISWNGWQYLFVEGDSRALDPGNGRQDLQGVGLFAQIGISDKDTNPMHFAVAAGVSGRGSIPRRDDDTWGAGFFYNDVQNLDREFISFNESLSGIEVYYDLALVGWANLTFDAQWTRSAFKQVDDATILGARLNVSF